ncbi:hypothetical protein ACFPRL_07450 [Pseudoclavibacter helvolus]
MAGDWPKRRSARVRRGTPTRHGRGLRRHAHEPNVHRVSHTRRVRRLRRSRHGLSIPLATPPRVGGQHGKLPLVFGLPVERLDTS